MSPALSFSHVHLYVDELDELSSYKEYESELHKLSTQCCSSTAAKDLTAGSVANEKKEAIAFVTHGRDVVRQLLAGFGFRITGARYSGLQDDCDTIQTNTRSLLITSKDPCGIQIVITAQDSTTDVKLDPFYHFDALRVKNFLQTHNGRQGIAVMAFIVDDVEAIYERYKSHHPKLVSNFETFPRAETRNVVKILEVYAYYDRKDHENIELDRKADKGTVLRFMQNLVERGDKILPGLVPQQAQFEEACFSAYSDHWVSNVFGRTEFLDVLQDTLGFTPKVDFNAGVVAAGEAQIESTVSGNDSTLCTNNKEEALCHQGQVYLPINNSLSEVGHVHLFLKELGQGIQHVASRVADLVEFVQAANDRRKLTGEGFTFLNIPRSYYGVVTVADLKEAVSIDAAEDIRSALEKGCLMEVDGAIRLDISNIDLEKVLRSNLKETTLEEYEIRGEEVNQVILRSRYKNLYSLLGDHLAEEKYLAIVKNQILVDIQGDDLLYQIFTCKVMHRRAIDEAPFFEFIQRVCSERTDENGSPRTTRPGCGGFGIRNFLTLFLSIEVSKAMQAAADAKASGDTTKHEYEQRRVECFTCQLNESNPILTEISDAMTEEGILRDKLALSASASLEAEFKEASMRKIAGSAKLLETSAKYNDKMKALRVEMCHV